MHLIIIFLIEYLFNSSNTIANPLNAHKIITNLQIIKNCEIKINKDLIKDQSQLILNITQNKNNLKLISILVLDRNLKNFNFYKTLKYNATLNKEQINFNNVQQNLLHANNSIITNNSDFSEQIIINNDYLIKNDHTLPIFIVKRLQNNKILAVLLQEQVQNMNFIQIQQNKISTQTKKIQQTLINLHEQAKWLKESPILGEILRAQISSLKDMPKLRQLDNEMAQLRIKRIQYEDQINKLLKLSEIKKDNNISITPQQNLILEEQLSIQRDLLNELLHGCDSQIIELTKLKISNNNFAKTMYEIQKFTHRYLFWIADVNVVNLSYTVHLSHDLNNLFSKEIFNQIIYALKILINNKEALIQLFIAFLFFSFSITSKKHYNVFLDRSSNQVGKVNQDHFSLTLNVVFWSILITMSIPMLWMILGYNLNKTWPCSLAVAIGNGMIISAPILWIFIIINRFSLSKGLFIVHFGWSKQKIKHALHYYTLSIYVIVPLIMMLITFNNYNEKEFYGTLGRFCFILICIYLTLIKYNLKNVCLLHNNYYLKNNIINRSLWTIIIIAPICAATFACLGYLTTAQELLARFEGSIFICSLLFFIYNIIRRWMFIQRRRIAFERAKQKRADMLAQRARHEECLSQSQLNEAADEVDKKELNLDTISAQSLQLVRSILTLIALLTIILIWSELYSAFSFLEHITLWDVNSTIRGVDSIQPVTLGSVIISILVFIITAQMVRNLPALLELALLQHLNLSPGTGYAITTLTKYSLMLLGSLIIFSLIGIEWSKLQWLVAALGVGLGFGLQEIFANFISGLMLLFEKPIRIGDTVTIKNLTGSITRINTRATTITDWDRKEIIVPNKAFITEYFINWSLLDTITRVILKVPAPSHANIDQITNILIQSANRCPLVLELPLPEVYLIDIQRGLLLFELRVFTAEISNRMPIRHQVHTNIINEYKKYNLELPFPPFELRSDQFRMKNNIY